MRLCKRIAALVPPIDGIYVGLVVHIIDAPKALRYPQHDPKTQIADVRVSVHFKIATRALTVDLYRHDQTVLPSTTNFPPIGNPGEFLMREHKVVHELCDRPPRHWPEHDRRWGTTLVGMGSIITPPKLNNGTKPRGARLPLMPTFYFHVRDDMDVADDEGAELRDVEAARDYATRSARALMCETMKENGRITLSHRIDIEDEQGGVVASVPFGEAIRIDG